MHGTYMLLQPQSHLPYRTRSINRLNRPHHMLPDTWFKQARASASRELSRRCDSDGKVQILRLSTPCYGDAVLTASSAKIQHDCIVAAFTHGLEPERKRQPCILSKIVGGNLEVRAIREAHACTFLTLCRWCKTVDAVRREFESRGVVVHEPQVPRVVYYWLGLCLCFFFCVCLCVCVCFVWCVLCVCVCVCICV
jgi:hypothetical protein